MGKKRIKGEAAIYDEIKKTTAIVLTPTAVLMLDIRAKELGISRSELVEQFARQEATMTDQESENAKKLDLIIQLVNKHRTDCTSERLKLSRWQKACLWNQELLNILNN